MILKCKKLDFETQKLNLPAFQGSEGDQNYVEKESLQNRGLRYQVL